MNKPAFISIPKFTGFKLKRLTDFAEGKPCLLNIPHVCNHDTSTTVAAHANWAEMGKGIGMKVPDFFIVHACSSCHEYVDVIGGSREGKMQAWLLGFRRQLDMWMFVAGGNGFNVNDVKAVNAALNELQKWLGNNKHIECLDFARAKE